jgi:5-methyltetrahydrofolate--homocysteine methyltransferase
MARNLEVYNAILAGDRDGTRHLVTKAAQDGADVFELLHDSMIPAMHDLGDRFSRNEVDVPDLLVGGRAMQAALEIIEPFLVKRGHTKPHKVCIGVVKGDTHDVGKNLVVMMLRAAGYEVVDLGADCDVERFEQAVRNGAKAVLCSVLLTTRMAYLQTIVDRFSDSRHVPVIVGGVAVSQEFADRIGADGYGEDAADAIRILDGLFSDRAGRVPA